MSEQGMDLGMGAFMWAHITSTFSAKPVDLSGRTVMVTGGNAGLGFETVLHFARNNASRIIIASRNRDKCEAAAQKVYAEVPSYRGKVDVMIVDFKSFKSVIDFCDAVNKDEDRLDVVVANAGILTTKYQTTADGWEEVLQVNDLSTGLMSLLLLPKLVETGKRAVPSGSPDLKPHLTIVASEVHYWAKFAQKDVAGSLLDALNDPKQYADGSERYNVSKLLNLFMAREIAKLPAAASGQVVVNTVNPGLCKSGFRDEMGPIVAALINFFSWTTEFGARNLFHAATQPSTQGSFVSHCKETPPSMLVVSSEGRAAQEKYWKECMDLWEGLVPGLKETIA